jgi:hypothetical protein
MTAVPKSVRVSAALSDARAARDDWRRARRQYHAALVAARKSGATDLELAHACESRTHHVANTIRNHTERRCACFDATEPRP